MSINATGKIISVEIRISLLAYESRGGWKTDLFLLERGPSV